VIEDLVERFKTVPGHVGDPNGQKSHRESAHHRAPWLPWKHTLDEVFGLSQEPFEPSGDERGGRAENEQPAQVGDAVHLKCSLPVDRTGADERSRDECRDHRGDHRGQHRRRSRDANDRFEYEERRGERRVVGGCESGGCARRHQDAGVIERDAESPADRRTERAAELDERAFTPDRQTGRDGKCG
jgi:hypothetical protein